jgi:threonine dehydrogenase-like Zn-dependent dehydrogenase
LFFTVNPVPCDTELSLFLLGCLYVGFKFGPNVGMQQVVHPADLCFKLPENVTLEEGAMCEPLSVGVHACRRAGVGPPTKVLILGAGPIGLVTMLSAHAFGSPKVVVADISPERLKVAKELGANATVLVSTDVKVRIQYHSC